MLQGDSPFTGPIQEPQSSAPNRHPLSDRAARSPALRNTVLILVAAILTPDTDTFRRVALLGPVALRSVGTLAPIFNGAIIACLLFGPLSLLPWWRRLILRPLAGLATASLLLTFAKSQESVLTGLLWVSVFSVGFTILAFRALATWLPPSWACLASPVFLILRSVLGLSIGQWLPSASASLPDWRNACLMLSLFCFIGFGLLSLLQYNPILDRAVGLRLTAGFVLRTAAVIFCSALIYTLSALSSHGVSYEFTLPGGFLGLLLSPWGLSIAFLTSYLAAGLSGWTVLRWSPRPPHSFVWLLTAFAGLLAIAAVLFADFLTTPQLKEIAIRLIARNVRSFVSVLIFCAALGIVGHRWAAFFYAAYLSTQGLLQRFLAVPITSLNQHDAGRIIIGVFILGVGVILWFLSRSGFMSDASPGGDP